MKKKVIITESQFERVKRILSETNLHNRMVREMKTFLDSNYTPTESFVREGGEYSSTPMIKVNLDEEMISPKELYEYLLYKFKLGEDFTQQVIRDWVDGKIGDNHMLSKNVSLK